MLHTTEIYGDRIVTDDLLANTRKGIYRNGLKRALDITLVLVGGVVLLPVILILALLVTRDGHAPFYWSERVGRNGRIFRMMKLRTMVIDADARLASYLAANPEAAEEWKTKQKLKTDPRITTFGRLLRKTSLDELPQLWNVLIGDMSLVGPRPMLPNQQILYPGKAYYALRPGVTGPWQVSERNDCAFSKRADFDRNYYMTLSLTNDLKIIAQTLVVVGRGTGY